MIAALLINYWRWSGLYCEWRERPERLCCVATLERTPCLNSR